MHNIKHAHGAGRCTPISDEASAGDAARGFRDQSQESRGNYPALDTDSKTRAAVEQADKAFTTLRARLALAGFEVQIVHADGGTAYLVQRWALHRELLDLAAVAEFADLVGARA